MNGRVFDYHLGRFHRVDPERSEVSVANVQVPTHLQSLNPYSYLMNNSLSGTDPTGYFKCETDGNCSGKLSEVEKINAYKDGTITAVNKDGAEITLGKAGDSKVTGIFAAWSANVLGANNGAQLIQHQKEGRNQDPSQIESTASRDLIRVSAPGESGSGKPGNGWLGAAYTADPSGMVGVVAEAAGFNAQKDIDAYEDTVGMMNALTYIDPRKVFKKGAGGIFRKIVDFFSPCNCFVAGTLVLTSAGAVPIEEIKVGDYVLARDDVTLETAPQPVVALIQTPDRAVRTLTVLDAAGEAESFEVTEDHPLMTADGWTEVEHLKFGDTIVTASGEPAVVWSVVDHGRKATTYNFTVAGYHTYFVGESGLWVHNDCVKIGGGATLDKLSRNEIRRIQNAADKGGCLFMWLAAE